MAKKGDTVFYLGGPSLNNIVQAQVTRARRTGRCDVEAQWFVYDGGTKGAYLGFRFTDIAVYPSAKAADDELSARKRFS